MSIYCFNKSSILKDSDMNLMINAVNKMLPAFCAAWSLKPVTCVAAPANTKPGTDMYCAFLDTSDTPDALAYHNEFANVPYGDVFVKTVLQYGGALLMGPNPSVTTVAQAFAHEVFEMLVNQNVNTWWQMNNGNLVAAEVCDAVQGAIVPIKVGNVTIGLSDYVLPAWSNPQAKKGPYNFLNTLHTPFQVGKGGYLIVMKQGNTSNVYGEAVTPYVKHRAENILKYMKANVAKHDGAKPNAPMHAGANPNAPMRPWMKAETKPNASINAPMNAGANFNAPVAPVEPVEPVAPVAPVQP